MPEQEFRVVLSYPFCAEAVNKILLKHARVSVADSRAKLKKQLLTADALICLLTDTIDENLLQLAPKLKVIGNHAVGINNIDLDACKRRGVKVCNTPDCLTRSTAELALTLLFAVAKRVTEGQALCRSGNFRGWAPELLLGQELKGRHAVIVGAGRIGTETAKLFRAVGVSTEFIRRTDSPHEITRKLRRAQILSLHCPYTPETDHWLDARKLSQLPTDAIVLNTARGAIIDEQALIRALRARKIFGAGLDVFENEPRIPLSLRKLPNCVLLPHVGSATTAARTAMLNLVLTGTRDLLLGKKPRNQVIF